MTTTRALVIGCLLVLAAFALVVEAPVASAAECVGVDWTQSPPVFYTYQCDSTGGGSGP